MAGSMIASNFDVLADSKGIKVLDLLGQAGALLRSAIDVDSRELLCELGITARMISVA